MKMILYTFMGYEKAFTKENKKVSGTFLQI